MGITAPPYNPTTPLQTAKNALLGSISYPAVMVAPPTITTQAAFAVSTIPGALPLVAANSPSVYGHGWPNWYVAVNAAINDGINHNYYQPTTPFPGSPIPLCMGLRFDGLQLDMLLYSSPGLAWNAQALIDGQLIALPFPRNAGGSGNTRGIVSLTFPSRKMRTIFLQLSTSGLAGFYIGPNDTIFPPDVSQTLMMGFTGDSYLQSGPATDTVAGISSACALALGSPLYWVDAVGGSGYTTRNAGSGNGINNFLDRLSAPNQGTFASTVPHIHVTMGGINDAAPLSQSQVQNYFSTLRGWWPNTVLVATGPWCPNGTLANDPAQKFIPIRDTIKAALATVSGPWLFIDNLKDTWVNSRGTVAAMTDATSWQTGSGYSGHLTGSGNGDLFINSDATHPNTAGVDNYASRLAANIRAGVLAL